MQQLRRMYPVMRGNYEKPPLEFCDRRGLFALDCRIDARWDNIAGRYVVPACRAWICYLGSMRLG